MEKDEFFIKRIRELANLSYQRDIVTFSDFLNLNEQNIINDRKSNARRSYGMFWRLRTGRASDGSISS